MKGFWVIVFMMMVVIGWGQAPHLYEHTYPVVAGEQPPIRGLMDKVDQGRLTATIDTLQSCFTRRWDSQMVYEVQNWLFNSYQNMHFDTVYLHDFPVIYHDSLCETSDNVIAIRKGLVYPDEYVVCGAHYDSYNKFEGHPDSLRSPGADDNASGVSGVMEMARILSTCSFERSLIFCNFAAEEIGLVGSAAYAKDCADQRMDIVGYFNLDMIGYLEEGSDIHVNLLYTGQDSLLAKYVFDFSHTYYPEMKIWQSWLTGGDSDYSSFNRNGYPAVHTFEDTHHSSPFIHTPEDLLGVSVNSMDQAQRFTELNLGLVAMLAGLISSEVADDPVAHPVIMPNPAKEHITVKGVSVKQITIYNLLGQQVVSRGFTDLEECNIEVGSLVPGLYLVQVLGSDGRTFMEKLKIEN